MTTERFIDLVMATLVAATVILLLVIFSYPARAQEEGDLTVCTNPAQNIAHARKQKGFIRAEILSRSEVTQVKKYVAKTHAYVSDMDAIDTIAVIYFGDVTFILYGGGGKVCTAIIGKPDVFREYLDEALGRGA